jgi:hypothetical protein
MRQDNRPPLRASALPIWALYVRPGRKTKILCPCCGAVVIIARSQIFPHNAADGITCRQSRRRFDLDLTYAAVEQRQAAAQIDAKRRQTSHVHRTPSPPAAPAIHRLAHV